MITLRKTHYHEKRWHENGGFHYVRKKLWIVIQDRMRLDSFLYKQNAQRKVRELLRSMTSP